MEAIGEGLQQYQQVYDILVRKSLNEKRNANSGACGNEANGEGTMEYRAQATAAGGGGGTSQPTQSTLSLPDLLDAYDEGGCEGSERPQEPKSRSNSISSYSRQGSDSGDILSGTPPFSVHGNAQYQLPYNISSTRHLGGVSNSNSSRNDMLSAKWSYDSSRDDKESSNSAQNMKVHKHTRSSYSPEDPVASSCSSEESRRPSMRPINLYSAIGSLENLHTTSVGSLNKRLLSSFNRGDFARAGGGTLIPPQAMSGPLIIRPKKNSRRNSSVSNVDVNTDAVSQVGTSHGPGNSNRNEINQTHPSQDRRKDEGEKADNTGGEENLSKENKQKDESSSASKLRSNLLAPRHGSASERITREKPKQVSYDKKVKTATASKAKHVEMFRPSSDAYTPRMEKKKIEYKPATNRMPVHDMASPMGTLQRPNFRDALRRVAMIMHQHILKIEQRFETEDASEINAGLFKTDMRDEFSEENFCSPSYQCTMVRIPMARPGMVYGLRKIRKPYLVPSENEIYEFAHQLFKTVQLSSECSIVCLIYVERLMEAAKVPLLGCTWRPVFMCGLLMASKVWQDLSSWNIEFASVYPQFPLDAINRLERLFLRMIKWDLYISSSLYAKYYFALRSLVEKKDFRQRYNRMVGVVGRVAQTEGQMIEQRTEQVKEEALMHLSKSM